LCHLLADVRVERDRAAIALHRLDRLHHHLNDLGGEHRRAGDVQMGTLREQAFGGVYQAELTTSTVLDVVNEVAISAVAIANKGASSCLVGKALDTAHVDTVALESLQVHPTEVVVPDAADDAAGLPEFRHLVDEDRRRTTRERPNEVHRFTETWAALLRHDFHEDLSDSHDLEHLYLRLRGWPVQRCKPSRERHRPSHNPPRVLLTRDEPGCDTVSSLSPISQRTRRYTAPPGNLSTYPFVGSRANGTTCSWAQVL